MAKKKVIRKKIGPKSIKPLKNNTKPIINFISILFYIFGFFAIIGGILFITLGIFIPQIIDSLGGAASVIELLNSQEPQIVITLEEFNAGVPFVMYMVIILGILGIGFGILSLFIGKGLWQRKEWARILAIIFLGIGIFKSLLSLLSMDIFFGLLWLIVFGIMEYYLAFDENVKKQFSSSK